MFSHNIVEYKCLSSAQLFTYLPAKWNWSRRIYNKSFERYLQIFGSKNAIKNIVNCNICRKTYFWGQKQTFVGRRILIESTCNINDFSERGLIISRRNFVALHMLQM